MVNLSSFIRYHATRTPDRLAIVYKDQRVTFAELLARIEKTAGFLAAHGIGPDDVVAVLMKNSIAFLEIAFAVGHIGAVFLPINFRLAADEVEYIAANNRAGLNNCSGSTVKLSAAANRIMSALAPRNRSRYLAGLFIRT